MNEAERSAKRHQDYERNWRQAFEKIDRKAGYQHAADCAAECRRLLGMGPSEHFVAADELPNQEEWPGEESPF